MSTYRLSAPYEQPPLSRRASGLALALAVNGALLLALLTFGIIPLPMKKTGDATIVDLLPESRSEEQAAKATATSRVTPEEACRVRIIEFVAPRRGRSVPTLPAEGKRAGYGWVADQREVSPDSTPSAKIAA